MREMQNVHKSLPDKGGKNPPNPAFSVKKHLFAFTVGLFLWLCLFASSLVFWLCLFALYFFEEDLAERPEKRRRIKFLSRQISTVNRPVC